MKNSQLFTHCNPYVFVFLLSLLTSNLVLSQSNPSTTTQVPVSQNSNEVCYDRFGNPIPCTRFVMVKTTFYSLKNRIYISPEKGFFFPRIPIRQAYLISDPRSGHVITYDLLSEGREVFLTPTSNIVFDLNSVINTPGRYTLVVIGHSTSLINFTFDKLY